MAVLEKLYIRGIRSFGPDEEAKIKFHTPLTLFLGQNGCGKTTIIESLKFGLTGELPSGTKSGSGFVNDPQLSNSNLTKGIIKVLFKDVKGDHIVVQRAVEAQLKSGGNLTFKNVLATVRWISADKSQSEDISDTESETEDDNLSDHGSDSDSEDENQISRCADVDSLCAQKLNVSKAILNSVIFCHQENSSWPLDEAKKLKEKFDEIFGATEYNKTVEKLRKMIKAQRDRIKIIKEQHETKRKVKYFVDKQKEKLDSIVAKLEDVKQQIEVNQNEMKPLGKRMEEILELESVLSKLQMEVAGKEKSLEGVKDQQKQIRQNISYIFEGTDQELEEEIRAFEQEQEKIKRSINDMEQKQNEIEKKLQETNRELQKMQIKLGQLKEEENQHNKRCDDRKKLVEKAKVKLNINKIEESEDDTSVVIQDLKNAVRALDSDFSKWQDTKNNEEKSLQSNIDKVRENFASTKQNLASKDKLITENQNKIRELNNKLDSLEHSDSQLKSVENKIETLQNNLRKRTEDFDELRRAQEIEELKDKVNQNDQLYNKLEREHRVLQQNYVTEQNIEREKLNIIEKRNEISRIKTKHQTDFEKIFTESEMPQHNLEKSIKNIENVAEVKCKELTKKVADLEKRSTTLEATIKNLKSQHRGYEEELKLNQNKVAELCKGKDFHQVLEESGNTKEKLQKDKGQYRSAKVMYEAFIREFEKEIPCCPVCETDFSSRKTVAGAIIQKLKRKIEELPRKLAIVERDLQKEEDFYNKLQQIKQVNDNIEILSNAKIPFLEGEIEEHSEELKQISNELNSTRSELENPQSLVEISRRVITDAALLDRYSEEIRKSATSVEELETTLAKVPSNRTREETEAQLGKVRAELSNTRNQLDNKKELFDENKRILQQMNTQIQNEIQKKLEAQKLMQEKPLLQTQLKESQTKIEELKSEKVTLNGTMNSLDQELKKVIKELDTMKNERRRNEQERRNELEANRRTVQEIEKLHSAIQQFISTKGHEKLERALEELRDVKSKIERLEDAKKKLNATISDKKQELASQATKFRDLTDNETLRSVEEKAKTLEKEIAELKKRIGDQNYKSVYREKERLNKQLDDYRRSINTLLGGQSENEKFKGELEEDLNKPENRNATSELLKKLYELKVAEISVDDLDTYTRSLEKSVLIFHKERMVQINKAIRELWRNIYKGNDIDYIEIKTEDTVGGAGGRKRNYTYKVVQVKKGVEIDMRGRCSAGQRVLACLVIRTALAETFSSHCGILALDEPTTNLDRENVMSLCTALSNMITSRQAQKNFQLLVITHDEEFLQTLTRDQSVSHYWRVQRNREGFSEIKKEDL